MADSVKDEVKNVAKAAKARFLKNVQTGVHFVHTKELELRGDLKECDAKGKLIAPPADPKSDAPAV